MTKTTILIALSVVAALAAAGGIAGYVLRPQAANKAPQAAVPFVLADAPQQAQPPAQDCTNCRMLYMPIANDPAYPQGGKPFPINLPYRCWDCFIADWQASGLAPGPLAKLTDGYWYVGDGTGWKKLPLAP